VELRKQFLTAVADRIRSSANRDWSPSLLAAACVDVLPVAGAGLSLSQKALRVPLGWSSESVGVAERAQTTLGSGPCLSAVSSGAPVAAGPTEIADRWPVYWDELAQTTSFRSVAAVPLRVHDQTPFGALDLYGGESDLSTTLPLTEVAAAIASPIAVMLSDTFDGLYDGDSDIPDWLEDHPAVERMTVWTAVGMVVASAGVSDTDALATIRAWAYGHERSLDDVACSLVSRTLSLDALEVGI
jgi:hypothetical protein